MQQQYRSYPQQAPQRSPHASSQRRGGIGPMMSSGPHPSVPLTQNQLVQQQQYQQHANDLAKRRSRKPTDKTLPDGVEDVVIDPEAVQRYKDLREIERKLDSTMTRKRLDVLDSANHVGKIPKTMRIWISNTVEDQMWQGNGFNVDSFDFTPSMEASYRVKIEGHLLDDDKTPSTSAEEQTSSTDNVPAVGSSAQDGVGQSFKPRARLSNFFKAISIEFDSARFRDGTEQNIEWKKPESAGRTHPDKDIASGANFDELTFKRNGDENANITVLLHRQEVPQRYELSPELADVVDMSEATQQEAVMGLWEYVRLSGLQEDEEKRNFRCDDALRKVVRRDVGYIPLLNDYVTQHLRPLRPISLPYTIRVDEDFHKDPRPTIYDVQVWVDDPLRNNLLPIINNPDFMGMLKDVTALDERLARLIQTTAVSKAKHSFLTSLSEDPANFVRNWLSSQKRDLDIIMGEATRTGGDSVAIGEEWRRGGSNSVWATQNARESVNVLLSKQR